MAKLELDHVGGGLQRHKLHLLSRAHLLHEVSEQQCVFAHPLNGLQQVGRQVHLISQLQLLPLHEGGAVIFLKVELETGHGLCVSHPEEGSSMVEQQSVRLGLVLAVQSVETELLLLLSHTQTAGSLTLTFSG